MPLEINYKIHFGQTVNPFDSVLKFKSIDQTGDFSNADEK